MTIRYTCEECGAVMNIKDELAGSQGRCPRCKAGFFVPEPEPEHSRPAVRTAEPKAPRDPADGLSDDDIERILESKDDLPSSGGYGVEASDEVPVSNNPFDEPPPEDEPPRKKKRSVSEVVVSPSASAAGIARELMAKGDKAGNLTIDERKGGRPFGGADHERGDEDDDFTFQEKLKYVGRVAGPVVAGITLVVLLYMWWLSRWERGDLPDLMKVSGVVTLNGAPLPGAEIQFHPIPADPSKPLKVSSSMGQTDPQGQYTLFYTASATGAVPGKHRVQIFAYSPDGRALIPPQYNLQTTLATEVKSGGGPYNFDLIADIPDAPVEDSAIPPQ